MRMRRRSLILALVCSPPACGFAPLVDAPPAAEVRDDLPGSTTILNDIQVSPAVIHGEDTVVLRDPVVSDDEPPYPLYYWAACDGVITQDSLLAREATWVAPTQPGIYAVTVNITNRERDNPSRVLPLCVAPAGQDTCSSPTPAPQTLLALTASPDHFLVDCPDGCWAALQAEVDVGDAPDIDYHWQTQRGEILGANSSVQWHLPRVDCCTETYTAVLTTCSSDGGATTGFATATVEPD